MNQERKAQWVAALRSGEYKQGTGYLHRKAHGEERFCCLGVASDLAWRAGAVEREMHTHIIHPTFEYEGRDCYPPEKVLEWFGSLGEPMTVVQYEDPQGRLYTELLDELNDSDRFTFDQIADMIERWM